MRASILTIGNELLKGCTLDTNSAFLSQELQKIGFPVSHHMSCEDDFKSIHDSLSYLLPKSNVLILSGGLGPTPDDITRDAIADFFGVDLIFSGKQYKRIQSAYKKYGKNKVPAIVKREAMYPANAKPLLNEFGIALGFEIRVANKLIIVLPGVPRELINMYEKQVGKILQSFRQQSFSYSAIVAKIIGCPETTVIQKLGKDFFNKEFDFGIYPSPGLVTVRVSSESASLIRDLKSKIQKRLKNNLLGFQEGDVFEIIGQQLRKKKKTVATAESCTGGLLGASLTDVPCSSEYYKGGIVCYSNELKVELGVPASLIKREGAVSESVAKLLAEKVRERYGATYGVGVTGIAGPTGGTKKKPVGTVYVAIAKKGKTIVKYNHFYGDRSQVRLRTCRKAMELIWRDI